MCTARLPPFATGSGERIDAVILNCTLKRSPQPSNTEALAGVVADALRREGVECETVRVVDHAVPPGVESDQGEGDEWPPIRDKVLSSEILIVASPTWLGQPSSVAKRALERMDAMLSETDDEGRPVAYNRVAGVVVTGNEDGAHHVIGEIAGALIDIGFRARAGVDVLEPGPGARRRLPRQRRGPRVVRVDRARGGLQPPSRGAGASCSADSAAAGLSTRPARRIPPPATRRAQWSARPRSGGRRGRGHSSGSRPRAGPGG